MITSPSVAPRGPPGASGARGVLGTPGRGAIPLRHGRKSPLLGNSTLRYQRLEDGFPSGAATTVPLPIKAFSVALDPNDNAFSVGALGDIAVTAIDRGAGTLSNTGQFQAPLADRVEAIGFGFAETLFIWTDASNPTRGRLCSRKLGPDGLPADAVVNCETNALRSRPDSDFLLLGIDSSAPPGPAAGLRAPVLPGRRTAPARP